MVVLFTAEVFVHTLLWCLQCLLTIGKSAFVYNFMTKALLIPALMFPDGSFFFFFFFFLKQELARI